MEREHITERAHGIDVSHHQESFIFAKTTGQIDFAIAKFSQGYNIPYSNGSLHDWTDFRRIWDQGVALVPIRGLYHYQMGGYYSWERQANEVLEQMLKLEPKPHMLFLDVEKIGNVVDKTFLADSLRMLLFWEANAPAGVKVGGYWNKDIAENYIMHIGLAEYGPEFVDQFRRLGDWYAQYWLFYGPDKQPGLSKLSPNWKIWQYTDRGDSFVYVNGEQWRHYGSPDLNVFNGSVADMRAWLGLDAPAPQPPAGDGLLHATLPDGSTYTGLLPDFCSTYCVTTLPADGAGTDAEPEPVPEPQPEPAPEPEPGVVDERKYGILRKQVIENGLTLAGKFTPATVQLQDKPIPDSRKGAPIPVLPSAWEYMRKINDDAGYKYARSVHMMWINSDYGEGETAHAESIACQLNFVSWKREENRCAGLECFPNTQDFSGFDPAKTNWYTRPELFFKAIATNLDNSQYINVAKDVDCFILLMARKSNNGTGELWLALDEIEPFPALPIEVTVAYDGVRIRERAGIDAEILGRRNRGDKATILEYRPLGASVWGRTRDGWICLLYAPLAGVRQFMTSWRLETPGVIPPG